MAATVQHTVARLTAAVDTTLAVQVGRRSVGVGGPTPVETASQVSLNPPCFTISFLWQTSYNAYYPFYILKSDEFYYTTHKYILQS